MTIENIADLAQVFRSEADKLDQEANNYSLGSSDRYTLQEISNSMRRVGLRIWEICDK